MLPASGSRKVLSLSHTSAINSILPTFSLRKCMTARTSDGFVIPSCPSVPSFSRVSSILYVPTQNLFTNMLRKLCTTSRLHILVLWRSCSCTPLLGHVMPSLASPLRAGVFSHAPLMVFPAGSYERSYGGCCVTILLLVSALLALRT